MVPSGDALGLPSRSLAASVSDASAAPQANRLIGKSNVQKDRAVVFMSSSLWQPGAPNTGDSPKFDA
jgi:hypothetical protein